MFLYNVRSKDVALQAFSRILDIMPKLTYKIKEIAGDYYYEKMSKEETL